MAIITNTEFKAYRSISVSTYDTLLTNLIASAQSLVERMTNVKYGNTVYTAEVYDGTGSEILQLRNPPSVTTAVSIVSDDGTTTALATTDWRENQTTGQLFRIGAEVGRFTWDGYTVNYQEMAQWDVYPRWPVGFQNIQVTYTGTAADNGMKQLMYELVNRMFSEIQDGGYDPGLTSETLGDYSWSASGVEDTTKWLQGRLVSFKRGDTF